MDFSLVIGFLCALLRAARVRRFTMVRTGVLALVFLAFGTLCEVVIIYVQLFGLGDLRVLAGTVSQVLVETMLEALPFTSAVLALQWARQFLRLR
ncbi:MAG: hypothetical protein AAGL18_06940 [Pseudomonadota bacterium]